MVLYLHGEALLSPKSVEVVNCSHLTDKVCCVIIMTTIVKSHGIKKLNEFELSLGLKTR